MKFATKLAVSVITIAATVIGSIWGGFEILDIRMDKKVKEGEEKVMSIMRSLKDERDAKIQGLDDKFIAEVSGLKAHMGSMDRKLDLLIGMGRRNQVIIKQTPTNKMTRYSNELQRSPSTL